MRSLIFLQGFALGGSGLPSSPPTFENLPYALAAAIVVLPLVWFGFKAVWPKDKW